MYEERFGTDWTTLSADAALKRMFALGVAEALGEHWPEERERVLDQASSAYDRSVLELSYREGQSKVEGTRPGREESAVWAEVLDEEFDESETDEPESGAAVTDESPQGVPPAVERASFLDPDTDALESVRLPKMLRRED